MRSARSRHPALDTAVFAAALLMAAFLARELWRRYRAAPQAAPSASSAAADPEPLRAGGGALQRAVSTVPPLRLSRVERAKPKTVAVPAPR